MYSLIDVKKYIIEYKPDGIIVDTNVLILFLIGSYDSSFIKKIKLTSNNDKRYSIESFETLKEILELFKKVVITPQIIAEISNLTITRDKIFYGDYLRSYLKTVINFLKSAEEHHQRMDCLWNVKLKTINEFGFTDMTIYELSKRTEMPILTDDFSFFHYSINKGIHAISLENIKNEKYQKAL